MFENESELLGRLFSFLFLSISLFRGLLKLTFRERTS